MGTEGLQLRNQHLTAQILVWVAWNRLRRVGNDGFYRGDEKVAKQVTVNIFDIEWDEKRGMYKDEPLHNWASHDADLSRYAALAENQMTNDSYRPPIHFRDKMQDVWDGR